jgi:hypothetical protein
MSAWVEGKLELKCSLDVLRKAIINIHPEWENFLLVDAEGHIPMYRFNGEREYNGKGGDKEVHLLIPGAHHPGSKCPPNRNAHNDWGFRKAEDGKWECVFADYGLEQAKTLEISIQSEVAIMKAKAIAQMRGYEIIQQCDTDEEKYVDIRINSDSFKDLN